MESKWNHHQGLKKCKDGPCQIYNQWGEKKGIAMNGAGASSRSPIISNQASQREDKAALTMNAHSEFHLTSTKSERKVIARGCQKPCGVRKNATKTELHQSSIIV